MKADELLSALATALGNKKEANGAGDVRKLLGLSTTALVNWRRRKNLTPRMIAGAMLKARAAAVADARRSTLKAIVEMFPLDVADSRDGVKDGNHRVARLPEQLPKREVRHGWEQRDCLIHEIVVELCRRASR